MRQMVQLQLQIPLRFNVDAGAAPLKIITTEDTEGTEENPL